LFSLPIQRSVELLAPSRDPDASLTNFAKFSSSDEPCRSWLFGVRNESYCIQRQTHRELFSGLLDLLDLGIGKAFDFQKPLACASGQGLQQMVSNLKYHQGKFEQLAAIVQMLLFLSLVISAALIPKPIISPQADDNGRRANHELAVHRCR
jgi:hypothetical protein